MIIYIILPLLLVPGFFMKNKSLCCLWCGIVLFIMSALYYNPTISGVFEAIPSLSPSALSFTGLPHAYLYTAELFTMITPDYRVFTAVISLISTAGLMIYIRKYCYYCAASAVTVTVAGFWFMSLYAPSAFLGLVISAFAFRYAFEKRFVRFAAILLLASCFMPEALILIPLYIIFIVPPTVWHLPVAAGAAFLLVATDITKDFAFFGEEQAAVTEFILPLIIIVTAACCTLAIKIIARRGSYNMNSVNLLLISSVLAMGAFNDGRLMNFALICFFPAALTLIPEIISVAKALISLVFKEKKRPVIICCAVILAAAVAFLYKYILDGGVFPVPAYETWLGAEVTV